MRFRIVNVLLFVFLFAATGSADPSTLHIGSGFGTPCATGGCPIFGTEINAVGPDLLSIHQTSGAPNLIDPVWLILGVADDPSGSVLGGSNVGPATLFHDAVPPIPLPIDFEAFPSFGSGFAGLMVAGQEIYTFLGAGMTLNNSNSFTNWSAAVSALFGFTPVNFGIYTYKLEPGLFGGFDGKDFIDVALSGIPEGTFAVAYGQDANGKGYGTPFTESGVTVPEPSSFLLLGTGLLGIGMIYRKKQKKA